MLKTAQPLTSIRYIFLIFLLLGWHSAHSTETGESEMNALIVVTNHDRKGDTGKQTGWYLSEVTHIYYPLVNAGYHVDFASPKGGTAPLDESSRDLSDPDNKRFIENPEIMAQLRNTLAIDDIDPKRYRIIHFAGGHGAVWDFPTSTGIQRVTAAIYEDSGIVSAICHGPAALVNVKLSNGQYLVSGKNVSAFTDAEEEEVGLTRVVPFLLESTLRQRGAIMHPAANWQDQSSVSERLVTGQNPQSGHSVGKKLVALAGSLKTASPK